MPRFTTPKRLGQELLDLIFLRPWKDIRECTLAAWRSCLPLGARRDRSSNRF
jgi:hypothetical protein